MVEPQCRLGELRMVPLELAPSQLAVRACSLEQPLVEPRQERSRAEFRIYEVGGQLGEALCFARQPFPLARRRSGEPGLLREGRQIAVPNGRRYRRGVDDLTEDRLDEVGLILGQSSRRCRGQRDHVGPIEQLQELGDQTAPNLEQVMALVEDHSELPCAAQPLGKAATRRAQLLQERRVAAATSDESTVLVNLVVGIEVRQGLVREHGDVVSEIAIGAGRHRHWREL